MHKAGTCWVTDTEIYINIPKCASTTHKEIMKKKQGYQANYHLLYTHEITNRKVWTIIREPFDRFISAMCHIKRQNKCPDIFNDEHFKPQTWFLSGIRIDEYIKFDHLKGRKINGSTKKERDSIEYDGRLISQIYLRDIQLYHSL